MDEASALDVVGVSATELQSIVRSEIGDAIDFIEQDIGTERAESTKYYRGDPLGNEEEGRSQVVSRDVKDAVRQVLPSLLAVFAGSERSNEFIPSGPEDVAQADQATDYVYYTLFQDNPGFAILHTAFKDALYNKGGVIKYWRDESVNVEYHEFSGLDDAALGLMLEGPGVELADLTSRPDEALAPIALQYGIALPLVHEGRIRRRTVKPRVRVMAVPPEEFLIDRHAVDIDSARYVGHRMMKSVNDLVALGYDPETLKQYQHGTGQFNMSRDRQERYANYAGGAWPEDGANPSERKLLYTESFIRVDVDGDGYGELRKVCTIGEGFEIVNGDGFGEPCDERPFATFCADPEPHMFFGDDLADQTKDLQRIRTNVMRGILDSLALAIHPRTGVVEGQVNIEDVLNTEMGAVIRMQAPGMVQSFALPFVGKEGLAILEMLSQEKDRRLGLHNMALEADALQSTTKAAVQAQVRSATQNLEMIARIFAETGMKRLFSGVLKLIVAHQDRPRMVRLRNEWTEIDPRAWNADMDVCANVGLGNGLTEERIAILASVKASQEQILQTLGPANPLVTLPQYVNTLTKMVEMAGFKDSSQFYNKLPPDFQLPAPPPKPTPEEILAQVEAQKTAAKAQSDTADRQLEYDKLLADILLRAAEIDAKHKTSVDVARIKRTIETDRLSV